MEKILTCNNARAYYYRFTLVKKELEKVKKKYFVIKELINE